jgi:hypothetical protein
MVTGDYGIWVVAGHHWVNREGYVVSERPWREGTEEFRWDK